MAESDRENLLLQKYEGLILMDNYFVKRKYVANKCVKGGRIANLFTDLCENYPCKNMFFMTLTSNKKGEYSTKTIHVITF